MAAKGNAEWKGELKTGSGTFTAGPPWMMLTSSPRLRYSPVAMA